MPNAATQSHSLLALQEKPPEEGDLTRRRYEIKYAYPHGDVRKLDAVLRVNHRPLSFNRSESMVSSIYFDDSRLTAFRENIDGIGLRSKYRLRWYDSIYPDANLFFEIKRRYHYVVTKDRYALNLIQNASQITYSDLIKELLEILPQAPRERLRNSQLPTVLVRYRRRHYISRDPLIPIRITLDWGITAFEQISKRRPLLRFAVPLQDLVVLEVKAQIGTENKIPDLLFPLRPRQSRFSKYALCCSRLGLSMGINEMAR
jgi:hypothetical protein